ncbi:unnamed protein product [Thelazia callipaeda]|uniref:Ig-like domain-containing protein n=1 Tax=Thelazia callipaeda TaxID=103827 RepID=A0A0N5D1U6_THECL|nr:unnamed protein product [Thelazia callipaeda]
MERKLFYTSKYVKIKNYENLVANLSSLLHASFFSENISAMQSKYPFVCSLDSLTRQKLLHQESFLPAGSPRIVIHPNKEHYFFPEGVNFYLSLSCTAIGNPFPKIRWFKGGVEEVQLSSNQSPYLLSGGSLLISANFDTVYDSYHCTAENNLGIVRSTVAIVRPAFISAFHDKRLDVHSINYLNSGARIECQAPPHYPRTYAYSWVFNGTEDQVITQSERIFISRDGTLYFSYNIKEDETSYACSIMLTSINKTITGPFFNLRLSKYISMVEFPPHIDTFQPQIFPEMPEVGESVFLECFAYARPSPTYRWSRIDGKPLSRKAALMNNGNILRIDELDIDDEGAYRCTAINKLGSNSAAHLFCCNHFKLKFAVKPEILTPLYDQIMPINVTVLFDCFLANRPQSLLSTIEWFRDASPLNALLLSKEERARIIIQFNKLTILSTRFEDSAIYQCIVSNEIGSTSSSARLTIVEFKPHFDITSMPKKLSYIAGMPLVIPCIYQSSPSGFPAWFRPGGEPIHNFGRVRQQPGIFFHKLIFDYLKSKKPNVTVLPKIKFFSSHTGNLSISCEVETLCKNTDDCREAQFDWALNDQPLRSLPLHKQITSILPSILGAQRLGRFACTSLYGGGASDLQFRPLPLSPTNIHVINITANSVKLSWNQPNLINAGQWHKQFRVKAYDGKEFGYPSRSTSWLKTLGSEPLEPINHIWWKKVNSHQVLLQWDPGELNNRSGPNLRYLIIWYYCSKNDTKYSATIHNENYILQLSDSVECEALKITILPINDIGVGHVSYTRISLQITCINDLKIGISQSFIGNNTYWLFSGLSPKITYTCNISAFDHYGHFGLSKETIVVTKFAAPLRSPNISAHRIYQIIFLLISETAEKPIILWINESDLHNKNAPSAEVKGLKLMHQYTFRVCI